MELTQVNSEQIFEVVKKSMVLPDDVLGFENEIVLSECVRRVAGFRCPCSKRNLIKELMNSLCYLVDDKNNLQRLVEGTVANLIVIGDLLELTDVPTTDLTVKSTWLFAAPPSFVLRQNDITVIGIAPDEANPLSSISAIQHSGVRRFIPQIENNSVSAKLLIQLGLIQISEAEWLRLPKLKSDQQLISDVNVLLENADIAGAISGHRLLDTKLDPKFYPGRWKHPSSETGRYIMKRPQIYGASQWCYGEFVDGVCQKFVDLPLEFNSLRQRGCDVGWHIQMAIDKQAGHPQQCRVRRQGDVITLDFFSPIPMWAERRLIAIAKKVSPINCLFSYKIMQSELQDELRFIREYLWMSTIE